MLDDLYQISSPRTQRVCDRTNVHYTVVVVVLHKYT